MKAVDQNVSLIPIVQLIWLVLDLNVKILVQDSVDIMLFVRLLIMHLYVLASLDIQEIHSFSVILFKSHVSLIILK